MIQIWCNESKISSSYIHAELKNGLSSTVNSSLGKLWGLGTELCNLSKGHTNLGGQELISAKPLHVRSFKLFLDEH